MNNPININEIDENNYNQGDNKNKQNDLTNDEDFNEQYNMLFDSTINIDDLKNVKQNPMKSSDLNLNKELKHSKRNVIINDEKQFLRSRKWDYLDSNKMNEINNKVELIYKKMNKKQLEALIKSIKRCNLENFYVNFNPQELKYPIGSLSSLNYLIEKAIYYSNENNIDSMFNDKPKLEPYIYKFRNVLGDGNCFYRGFIFSLLENIVVTNNIMKLKELLILFNEKINLKNPLIEKKEYLKIIQRMNIGIVNQILYYLINIMEKEGISQAYQILIKISLYCQDFDFGIIFFVRYLLYEYISSNENKIYSKENQIDIGCLLPEFFVEDKGQKNEYLFENYYSLQLMQPKSFAEKIVIYIAPFVFDCNLNILIYEYGSKSFVQEKQFLSEEKRETDINLLFRKAHYDIYYKKDYFEKYSVLDTLPNIYENIKYLNQNKKDLEEKIKKEKQELIEKDTQDNENYSKIFGEQNNKEDLPKCLQCKKTYNNKENVFGLCDKCLNTELKTQLLTLYIQFLEEEKFENEDFYSFLKNKKCTISLQQNIYIFQAINNSEYKFEDLMLDIKKSICWKCHYNIEGNNYYIELPCKCRLCKKECFDKYIKIIEKGLDLFLEKRSETIGFTTLDCHCGYNYNLNSIFYMIKKMEDLNLKEQKEIYQTYIKRYWKWKCMSCGDFFSPRMEFFRVMFEDLEIDKKLLKKKTEFYHLICRSCATSQQINVIKKIDCQFCNSKHEITDIKKLDQDNKVESDCLII